MVRQKKTRMFFEKALKKPNDNSLAQMEWLSKQDNHLFNFNALYYKNVPNPFEAYALEQYRQSNWQESINQVIHWFIDLPYSKRPVTLGAYIASTFLEKQDLAVTLCELGLKANPHDPTILNNIIYSLALSNRVQEAEKYMEMLKRVKLDDISAEMKITLQATMGLMSLRSGSNDIGKQLYKLAIDNSVIIKDDYLENLALINFLRELMLIKDSEVDDIAHRIQSIPDINLNADIKFLKTGILKKYNEYKQEI